MVEGDAQVKHLNNQIAAHIPHYNQGDQNKCTTHKAQASSVYTISTIPIMHYGEDKLIPFPVRFPSPGPH